tara:strand:- start:3543 stop:3983 length:441 start_codon:yes stop_codon:yes gene_type:complete
MRDFKLNANSIGYFIQELWKLDLTKSWRITVVQWREKRSLSQNAFQHVIYKEISAYLIGKGRTEWTEKKTKFEMKNNFLGWEVTECTNVHTGEVTTKETLIETSGLDIGVSGDYTTKLLDFAQNIGCTIKIPAKCDYRDYLNVQDE